MDPAAAGTGVFSGRPPSVASRFVSQTELTEAQKRREQELKDAYARIGQEPPAASSASEGAYDPRSLYERLKANRDAKQEEWDERMRLSNHFRGIDASESDFLNHVAAEQREHDALRSRLEREELEKFR
ncbi:hypothetical protein K437DRAFT_221657, partial [Tilletiaria anomala UBC 951]